MNQKTPHRSYLSAAVHCRCPRCREGSLFVHPVTFRKKNLDMHRRCPVCGQPTEIEVGFYYGTSYVSYAITIAISAVTFVAWYVLIGMSTEDYRLFYWLGLNALLLFFLQPWLMRISRSLWLSWFVRYDSDWKENAPKDMSERMNADQANNW